MTEPAWMLSFMDLGISFLMERMQPRSTLFPYTTLFRSRARAAFFQTYRDIRARKESGERAEERSEEYTSELQSRRDLVCRLLLEKINSTTAEPPIVPMFQLKPWRISHAAPQTGATPAFQ